jgi:hypothetical protein
MVADRRAVYVVCVIAPWRRNCLWRLQGVIIVRLLPHTNDYPYAPLLVGNILL